MNVETIFPRTVAAMFFVSSKMARKLCSANLCAHGHQERDWASWGKKVGTQARMEKFQREGFERMKRTICYRLQEPFIVKKRIKMIDVALHTKEIV